MGWVRRRRWRRRRRPTTIARAAAMRSPAPASRRTGSYRPLPYMPSHTLHNATYPARTAPGTNSIRVLAPRQQRDRRFQQDVDVEQHRPVLDVIQIELDALLDLLFIVDFAAPAVDLRPTGDAGLYAVAREVTVDGFVEQAALQLALHRMRAGTDQRQIALEHHVEQLRQFVEAGLADEAADAGDAGIVLGHDLGRKRIGLVVIHRAEFEHVDAFVVEAETFLPEQHRARAVELDRQRDQRHHRRQQHQ